MIVLLPILLKDTSHQYTCGDCISSAPRHSTSIQYGDLIEIDLTSYSDGGLLCGVCGLPVDTFSFHSPSLGIRVSVTWFDVSTLMSSFSYSHTIITLREFSLNPRSR